MNCRRSFPHKAINLNGLKSCLNKAQKVGFPFINFIAPSILLQAEPEAKVVAIARRLLSVLCVYMFVYLCVGSSMHCRRLGHTLEVVVGRVSSNDKDLRKNKLMLPQ